MCRGTRGADGAARTRLRPSAETNDLVSAENPVDGSDQQACHPSRLTVMITGRVPTVRLPPDHADRHMAASVPARGDVADRRDLDPAPPARRAATAAAGPPEPELSGPGTGRDPARPASMYVSVCPRGTSTPMAVTCGVAHLAHTGKQITAGQRHRFVSEDRLHQKANASWLLNSRWVRTLPDGSG